MDAKDNGQKVEWIWLGGQIAGTLVAFETPLPLQTFLENCPERIHFRKYTLIRAEMKMPGKLTIDFAKSIIGLDPDCQGFIARDGFMYLNTISSDMVKNLNNYWGEVPAIIPATKADLRRL